MKSIVVRTFDNYFTANILLTRLQHHGIDCQLLDEYTVTIDPILSNAIGGIKLIVDVKDAAACDRLLKEFDNEYRLAAVCPNCMATNFLLVPQPGPKNFVTSLLTWLFSSYAVPLINIYKCGDCGYETRALPENTAAYN